MHANSAAMSLAVSVTLQNLRPRLQTMQRYRDAHRANRAHAATGLVLNLVPRYLPVLNLVIRVILEILNLDLVILAVDLLNLVI